MQKKQAKKCIFRLQISCFLLRFSKRKELYMFKVKKVHQLLVCLTYCYFVFFTSSISFGATKCVALSSSSSCDYIGPTEWQTDWTSRCNGIDISGVSVCANYENDQITGNGAVINTVWKNSDVSKNRACFCRIIGPVISRWVYAETYNDAGSNGCAQWCQHSCAGKIADTVNNAEFHNNILGQFFE